MIGVERVGRALGFGGIKAAGRTPIPRVIRRNLTFIAVAQMLVGAGGQLTPSLKLKRSVVMKQYESAVDGLYSGSKE